TTTVSETTTPKETTTVPETTTTQKETTTPPPVTTPKEEVEWDKVVYGDVNLDGDIRITDIIEFNKFLIGSINLSPTARENANCVYDDRLDVSDNMQIAKYLVSQITRDSLGRKR
ncbi:MAG: hypothetical protein GX286_03465, partial [Clostridiales bacterium]|nr:hypothetical protein [Clostridiales bacterium]